jgi:hypothetical protein
LRKSVGLFFVYERYGMVGITMFWRWFTRSLGNETSIRRRELEARIGPSRDVIAIALRPTDPANRWMSSFLAMLPSIEADIRARHRDESIGRH